MARLIVMVLGSLAGSLILVLGVILARSQMKSTTMENLSNELNGGEAEPHPYNEKLREVQLQKEAEAKRSLYKVQKNLEENEDSVNAENGLFH